MRARFSRAAFTATLLLGSAGIAPAGEPDSFFADLDRPTPAGPAASASGASVHAAGSPTDAPAKAGATTSRAAGQGAPGAVDPLGMDALFDAGADGRVGTTSHPRVAEAASPAQATPEGKPGDAASAPTGKELGKEAGKGLASGKADVDPEPDVAIKPPTTASSDPLEAPRAPGAGDVTAVEPPAQPLPPLNTAIKAALDKRDALEIRGANARERRKEHAAIAFFYAAHGFAPVWSDGGKPVSAVEPVLGRLARAGEDALTLAAPPKSLTADGAPDAVAASEIALSDAVVAYARQATGARVDPRTIGALVGAKPELADPAEVLESVAAAGAAAGDTLRDLNPTEPRYVALREALARTRAARAGSARAMPAVADVRRANGLSGSGELSGRGAAILSHGQPTRLEGTLIANMEMWRWMPRDLGADRIEVDVPAFTVTVFHDGAPAAHNRVVVGKIDTPTPLFSNTMKYLIVNPVWNVPESIVDKEMLRKDGDADGIRARGFDVSTRNGKLVVKQPSGEKNALGRVKFMFPNDYAVYLHDTPSKALFSTPKRAYSHGCVRVDQPFDFAESVLNDGVGAGGKMSWSQERLHKLLGDKERYVNLPKPLPIHIEYFTAVVDRDSQRLQLRDDVYDYAHKVAVALGQESPGDAGGEAARTTLVAVHHHPRAIAAE